MDGAARKPDIEITRRLKNGMIRSYGHLYWKPFLVAVFLFGRIFLFKEGKLKMFASSGRDKP